MTGLAKQSIDCAARASVWMLCRDRRCANAPRLSQAMTVTARLLLLCAFDAFEDQLVGVLGAAPAQHLHPFALFEILVVLEEVLDLLQGDVGQVAVGPDLVVALGQFRGWHRDDLL